MILSEARDLLFDVVVPTLDSEENVARFDRYLNLVQERFINSGKWSGMIRELGIVADQGVFTLPPRYVAALAAKSPLGCPLSIANQWFLYRYGGCCVDDPALWGTYGYQQCQDLGDGYVSFRDSPYVSYFLKFTRANAGDDGTQVLVKGADAISGSPVFSLTADGVAYEGLTVTLSGASVTTSQAFTGRLECLLKLRTKGYIYLDAVDTTTAETTRIGLYSPSEVAPCYHRYTVGCDLEDIVFVLCKVRYLPAIVDSDEVIPGNASALRAGLAALKCEAEGDVTRRDAFLADGLKILSDETREKRGGARFSLRIDPTAFQFQRLWQGK